jgi:hypothetical protein
MSNLTFNFLHAIAHTILLEQKGVEPLNVAWVLNNDPPAPTATESMDSILKAYNSNLPKLLSTTSAQILPTEQAQLNAAQQITPQYNALVNGIDRTNKMFNANTDVGVLAGPGAALAHTAQNLDKEVNPEFYKSRETVMKGYEDLLKSLNPANTNVAAERAVNAENVRSGNLGNTNSTSTVSNAMKFGDEGLKRSAAFGSALQGMTGFMPTSKSTVDIYGRPSQATVSNTGATNVGASTQAFGTNTLNSITGLQSQANEINANRRDVVDRINGAIGSYNG